MAGDNPVPPKSGDPALGVETLEQRRALEVKLFGGPQAPVELGRLRLVRPLGSGAMGTVYLAHDPALDREVAVKLLRKGLLSMPGSRERMLREAKTLARLNHPNILTIHDLGVAGEQTFITTELATGGTLAQWCAAHPEPSKSRVAQVVDFAVQAAAGLAAAHDAGLVHRDIKPSNLLLGEDGTAAPRLLVADFGLARPEAGDESEQSMSEAPVRDTASGSATPLTDAGAAVGTPAYMAPEQFFGRANARSDQFGWGVSFHEALFGTRPFIAQTREAMLFAIQAGEIEYPDSGVHVPQWIRRILLRCLASEPDHRFASMRAVLDAIDQGQTRRRRLTQVLGVVGVGALVGLPGFMLRSDDDPCAQAGNRIEAVWDDSARTRVLEGLSHAKSGFAEATAARTADALNEYATAWQDARVEACAATHVRHEQSEALLDNRARCLDGRLAHLEALVDVFAEADARVTQRAARAVAGLPRVEACADPQYVAATIEPPEEAIAEAVKALGDRLAKVNVLAAAGRYEEGLSLAQEVVEEARVLNYEPLLARATIALGRRELGMGQSDAAATNLRAGLMKAQSVGDDESVRDGASGLARALGIRLGRHDEALVWTELARATLPRLGPSNQWRLADILSVEGSIRNDKGEVRESLELLSRARAIALEHGRALTAANVLGEIAITQHSLGEYEEAVKTARVALEERRGLLGTDHPQVAKDTHNLGSMLTNLRRPEEARPLLELALQKRTEAFGPDHVDVASSLLTLGLLNEVEARHDAAIEKLGRALEIYETKAGPDHPRTAMALNALARVYDGLEDTAAALPLRERSFGIHQRRDPKSAKTFLARVTLGHTLFELGRMDDAREHLEPALVGLEGTLGKDHVHLAFALTSLGRLECGAGHRDQGLPLLRRAATIRSSDKVAPALLAGTEVAIADCLADRTEGRAIAKRALARVPADADSTGEATVLRTRIETWLADHPATPDGSAAAAAE